MKIVELFKFPSLFINQFYPRPGTPAARMKRIDTAIVSTSRSSTAADDCIVILKIMESHMKADKFL